MGLLGVETVALPSADAMVFYLLKTPPFPHTLECNRLANPALCLKCPLPEGAESATGGGGIAESLGAGAAKRGQSTRFAPCGRFAWDSPLFA